MRRNERDGVVFYSSELLDGFAKVVTGVSTRLGGVSSAPYDTLNLSAFVGDDPDKVAENTRRFYAALGVDASRKVDAKQAQADRVARVTEKDAGSRIMDVDGLITDVRGIPLVLRFADCVPILFYDPARRAIGIAHAGWRGTVGHVVTNTVKAMGEAFGTRPADLVACIGPSIGPCCYEVGEDVGARVREAFPQTADLLIHRNASVHLDLWQANAVQLDALGVKRVEVAGLCTSDRTDEWYSWRRENGRTGRFAAAIGLTE